jgi:hypothetical protein
MQKSVQSINPCDPLHDWQAGVIQTEIVKANSGEIKVESERK